MEQDEKKCRTKNRHLAKNMAKVLSIIMICIFACLIGTVVLMSGSALRASISNEFSAMAKGTGIQIENVLSSAETAVSEIVQYLKSKPQTSSDSEQPEQTDREFRGLIYGNPVSESSYEAEKYTIQNIRQTVKNSQDIVGMGVLFEPYALGCGVPDYSLYISKGNTDKDVTPYLPYRQFSAQEYYSVPRQTLEPFVTAPYEDAGYTMVTYCYPILIDGQFQGVITADINVGDFSKTVFETDRYPSKYTTIMNQEGILIYDTEDLSNVGKTLYDIISDPNSRERIQTGISGTDPFQIELLRDDGQTETCFFYPILSHHTKWWSITALEKSDLNSTVTTITLVLLFIAVLSLAITILLVTLTIRKMLRPIDAVVEAAESIASGNLNIQLQVYTNDEIGTLTAAFNRTIQTLKNIITDVDYLLSRMADGDFDVHTQYESSYSGDFAPLLTAMRRINDSLSDTLAQINQSADLLADNAEQVSYGSQALSQGAGEQAASMEELAATIEDISFKINSTAQNALEAQDEAKRAGGAILACNEKMQELIAAMTEINHKSDEIDHIIRDIEDIAFQTNILALNASVEAARAGDSGRGFAVVANEVRSLANRSAEASKNTSTLIKDSIDAVKKGTKLANITAESLLTAVDNARSASSAVEKISDAAGKQAVSVSQINQSMEEISGVVQTNSATAEESAAASEELSGLAQILKTLVNKFKLKTSYKHGQSSDTDSYL